MFNKVTCLASCLAAGCLITTAAGASRSVQELAGELSFTAGTGDYWSAAVLVGGIGVEAASYAPIPAAGKAPVREEVVSASSVAQLIAGLQDAVAAGDWAAVARDASALQKPLTLLDQRQPAAERLSRFAATLAAQGKQGTKASPAALCHLSDLAVASGRFSDAERYAQNSLAAAQAFPETHRQIMLMRGWTLIGVARLKQGILAGAIDALHQSLADLPPSIGAGIGPSMRLAKELLSAGQTAEVAQYVSQCASHHWNAGGAALAAWQTQIASGKIPDFGVNRLF
ncbi:MAG TPA: hypothetical protein VN924_07045 [Bryobacteraceae bacterium]|nr:hypothetical protein [Bryobacteraceae bacterium]